MTRAIAIDWSGAKKPKGKIWTAMSEQGRLVELAPAATREKAISWLLEHLKNCPTAIAGLDFAFSMPRWFMEKKGASTAGDFWALVEREGEDWLRRCEPPFWGRPGKRKPDLDQHFRRTEEQVDIVRGIKPKSVFQVGGAGAVGTGSIRGMPFLSKIKKRRCLGLAV